MSIETTKSDPLQAIPRPDEIREKLAIKGAEVRALKSLLRISKQLHQTVDAWHLAREDHKK